MFTLPAQSAEYDKRVANITLFIYIGHRDYIQIVATCPDLVTTCQDPSMEFPFYDLTYIFDIFARRKAHQSLHGEYLNLSNFPINPHGISNECNLNEISCASFE